MRKHKEYKMTDDRPLTTNHRSPIRVLIVEDSPVVREFLVHILTSDPEIEVVGSAHDGEEALEAAKRAKPDLITMDIHMPKMDGFTATRRIMETQPLPIVIVSGSSTAKEASTAFKAMEAGALAVVSRPKGIGHTDYERTAKDLVQTVKLMSEVRVIRRSPLVRKPSGPPAPKAEVAGADREIRVVAIGGSTGGPLAVKTILSGLSKGFSVPILIAQHIASGFIEGFAQWLTDACGLPVHVAAEGELLLPGHAYVAPDGFYLMVGIGNRIALKRNELNNGVLGSVSCLFESVEKVFGKNAVGILLTGMGRDGAESLKSMKEKGAITIAQDKDSSVVFGMPKEAIDLGAATFVLPPEQIVPLLLELVSKKNGQTLPARFSS